MSDATINLLLQIPLAGVVVVVVYMFQRSQEKIADKNAEAQTAQTQQLLDFMKSEADVNREFLKTQREQSNAAIARMAEENKLIREEQARTTMVLDRLVTLLTPPRKRNRNV